MNWLGRIGLGSPRPSAASAEASSAIAQGLDDDILGPVQQFAQFGAGCFWGVELAFQRVSAVTATEVRYTQGTTHNPTYNDVCSRMTNQGRDGFDAEEGPSTFRRGRGAV